MRQTHVFRAVDWHLVAFVQVDQQLTVAPGNITKPVQISYYQQRSRDHYHRSSSHSAPMSDPSGRSKRKVVPPEKSSPPPALIVLVVYVYTLVPVLTIRSLRCNRRTIRQRTYALKLTSDDPWTTSISSSVKRGSLSPRRSIMLCG